MRSNPQVLEGVNKLWIRFFLLAVFCTMYIRDHSRKPFFDFMGIDVDEYDRAVIKLTNLISRQVFPETVDTEHEGFWALMHQMWLNTDAMRKAEQAATQAPAGGALAPRSRGGGGGQVCGHGCSHGGG
jgi:magnesium-protoporphyrin IX monomethyl ester (oxidative) cyclase